MPEDMNVLMASLGEHTMGSPLTLNDVFNGKVSVADAVYAHPSGLKVIPSSHDMNGATSVNSKKMTGDH